MRQIPLGAKGSFNLLVQPEHLADRFKDAMLPPVFATPVMIMVMENAALTAIRAYLDPGESAVGTAVNVRHLAATPVGCLVSGEAESLNQKPTSANRRLPLTAFETHNGRSTFAAGTALHAPKRKIAGRQIEFAVRATEGAKEIGVGSHSRVIIDVAKFTQRLG